MKRLFVVGDIHGCSNELVKLLELIDANLKEEDEVVFLGDYIDRGPDSKGVIDILIERSKNHPNKHVFIKGNHEDMMLCRESYWALNGGTETLKSYGMDWVDYANRDLSKVPSDHMKFLNELLVKYRVGRTVCVHAGLDPRTPYDKQDYHTMIWSRDYVRFEGTYEDDVFVVYGHTPVHEYIEKRNQLGIDTACVFGGKLTCAIIEPDTGIVDRFLQVKSEFSY